MILPMRVIFLLVIIFLSSCGSTHHYETCGDPCPPEPIVLPDRIRVALVLGSGGVRGMAHVGVLEELEKAGIKFDLIVGCSAGSLVGALYCDNPCIEDLKDAVAKMRTSNILDINLFDCRFGLSQGTYLKRVLCQNLSTRSFDELKIPLILVATDLFSGELVPIGSGDLITAVQASCAIPLVFAPVKFQDRILVDGGVINPVPVCIARDIVNDISEDSSEGDDMIVIAVDLCDLLEQTFPDNLLGVAKRSAEIAFLWQNSACTKNSTIIIKPKLCNVGMFDDTMKEMLYEAGKEACREAVPDILKLLKEKNFPPPSGERRLFSLPCYKP